MTPLSTSIHVWRHVPWDVAQEIEVPITVRFTSAQPGNPTSASLIESTGTTEGGIAEVAEDIQWNNTLAFKSGSPITLTPDEWALADSHILHTIRTRLTDYQDAYYD